MLTYFSLYIYFMINIIFCCFYHFTVKTFFRISVVTVDNFIAREIGIQNSAGPDVGQALAPSIASDRAVLYCCRLKGYQDTLHAQALRQFCWESQHLQYNCFIFGNAAAMFQRCYLILQIPSFGTYNVIMANGRSDPGQETRFTVQNCWIGASSGLYPNRTSV